MGQSNVKLLSQANNESFRYLKRLLAQSKAYSDKQNLFFLKNKYMKEKVDTTTGQQHLDQFGRPYPPKRGKYYTPAIAVDAIVLKQIQNQLNILLVQRATDPFKDKFALPGGYIDYNESPEEAVLRELKEETNITGEKPILFTVKGDPARDPRGFFLYINLIKYQKKEHVISIVYGTKMMDAHQIPNGQNEVAQAKFIPVKEVLLAPLNFMAFDHQGIIEDVVVDDDFLKKIITDTHTK